MTTNTPVLLAMDFQNGIAGAFEGTGVLENAARAVDAARTAGIPVLWVRVAFRPGYPETVSSPAFSRIAEARGDAMTQENAETQIHPALFPREDEPVVLKRRISAFSGSDLDILLRATEADTLVLSGIATSGVVLSTLRQAADLDYRIIVLEDACADRDEEVHRVLTQKVFPSQAEVLPVNDWANQL
ncbi:MULTISPECIES: cysteine hydrolase family protein [Micrococcaceae]|uniref:cysteine hydrolase family protein n=1 Tax=unclassified Kocuria TaxID=2649579 RepID=UPI001011C403|nr:MULTISPECIES: isochorismatase family cysteine hydrolase [unclassified Kocuria]